MRAGHLTLYRCNVNLYSISDTMRENHLGQCSPYPTNFKDNKPDTKRRQMHVFNPKHEMNVENRRKSLPLHPCSSLDPPFNAVDQAQSQQKVPVGESETSSGALSLDIVILSSTWFCSLETGRETNHEIGAAVPKCQVSKVGSPTQSCAQDWLTEVQFTELDLFEILQVGF